MLKLNRRAMIALAAAASAAIRPALAQDAKPSDYAGDFSLGDPNAKVKLIEYASFTCSHCANFHASVMGELKKNYIDTGKVYFTLREVYFDRYGLWAAMVARCGGEERYFPIHDMLFEKQAEWLASTDPVDVSNALKALGISAGLDQAALDECLNNQAWAEALVAEFEKNMAADQVQGTPTLIINGTTYSNMSYQDLAEIIDAELAS